MFPLNVDIKCTKSQKPLNLPSFNYCVDGPALLEIERAEHNTRRDFVLWFLTVKQEY